jgi:hypothetical protein
MFWEAVRVTVFTEIPSNLRILMVAAAVSKLANHDLHVSDADYRRHAQVGDLSLGPRSFRLESLVFGAETGAGSTVLKTSRA